jgi:hypothetical protein
MYCFNWALFYYSDLSLAQKKKKKIIKKEKKVSGGELLLESKLYTGNAYRVLP